MKHWFVFSMFLYFPEDKSEYIPAALSAFVFLIAAIFTMKFIIKTSRKEAEKAKEHELAVMKQIEEEGKNH